MWQKRGTRTNLRGRRASVRTHRKISLHQNAAWKDGAKLPAAKNAFGALFWSGTVRFARLQGSHACTKAISQVSGLWEEQEPPCITRWCCNPPLRHPKNGLSASAGHHEFGSCPPLRLPGATSTVIPCLAHTCCEHTLNTGHAVRPAHDASLIFRDLTHHISSGTWHRDVRQCHAEGFDPNDQVRRNWKGVKLTSLLAATAWAALGKGRFMAWHRVPRSGSSCTGCWRYRRRLKLLHLI